MTNKTIGLFLLATTFLSSPAGAAALTPTLDTIKREAADLSGNFALSELVGALLTGAVEVKIGDKSYYFMPSGENAALLATLAGTPAGNLKEDANGIFELNGQKYGFDVASIPDSVFEYAENSVKDYNFIVKEADAEGNLTTKRYKINLKPDNFSASKSITWMEVSKDKKSEAGVIVAELPRKQSKYFQYTYTKPADYTESNTRINDTLSADSVNKVVFKTSDGSAIYNTKDNSSVNITADFIGNSASLSSMISNRGFIGNISGNFMGNFGQAIYNSSNGTAIIGDITGNFLSNYVQYLSKYSKLTLGGAVYSNANLSFTAKGKQRFFSGNYTNDQTRGKNYNALFVQSVTDLASAPVIAFDTTGGGARVVNDSIEGGYASSTDVTYAGRYYNLSFTGDGVLNEDGLTDQYISINNDIINAGEVTVEGTTLRFGAYQHEDKTANNWDGHGRFLAALKADGTADLDAEAVTSLSLNNAAFDLYNKYQDMVNLKGWKASGNSFLHVDVDVENLTADVLNVNGNVEGTTKLVLYPTSDKDIRGESILFAQSTNDTKGSADSFKVWRVYRSPYMFETKYTKTGENANKWELEMNDTANDYAGVEPGERPDPEVPDLPDIPDPDLPDIPDLRPHPMPAPNGKIEVTPEVIGYQSVTAAAVAQNANLIYNVMNKVTDNRLYCPGCGFYDYYWNGEAFHNLWVNPVYTSLSIKSPTEIDADVWGIEAGGDLQHDLNNKLGLFVSYRKGSYDMNGDGKHYYSTVGSEIDIDSYLAGLYYRYDRNNWYAFATLYGGIQQADIKTDDGIKSDTDGVEFGASLEAGYDYNLTDTVYLTPSLGVFYTQVNYDDATDSVGKKAEYNDLKQIELEAGVKLTKVFRLDEGYANVYVKPSVVQTIVDGDEVNITGLGKVNTLDDETLGRIELGGRYGFTDQLSAYGWANYTFGSDYDATTVGLGLNCAF